MVKTRFASALLITTALLAAPAGASADGVFASTSAASKGARVGAASASHRLSLLLTLRADDAALTAYASAVSNPSSPLYGKYLEPEQIARRFGSLKADRARVTKALRKAGLPARTGLGGFWIETEATVAQAGALFSTGFASYRAHTSGKRYVAPTAKPTLPPALAGTVTGVVGLDDATIVAPALAPAPAAVNRSLSAQQRALGSSIRGNTGTQAGCAAGRAAGTPLNSLYYVPPYTPNQINEAYGLSSLHRRGYRGQGQRIALIESGGFRRADLETAAACFGYKPPATSVTLVGESNPLPVGAETTLDLQVISAAAPGLKSIQVVEGSGTLAVLAQAFAAAIETPRRYRASVISASIGSCESTWTVQEIASFERVLSSAAAAGITVTTSSGDTGSTDCQIDDNSSALAGVAVNYPASSSWVTGIGGTNFSLNSANHITEEVVWNESPTDWGAGGGGTSVVIDKPSWQKGPGITSGELRQVPDIALLADSIPGYPIYCPGSNCFDGWSTAGGTSAATPLFAAGIAIANQQAKAAGQTQVGFLNPAIYKLAAKSSTRKKVFRDVTTLGNDLGKLIGPAFTATGCCSAAKYYDLASGWGSINFPSFSYEVRKLRSHRPTAVTGGNKR